MVGLSMGGRTILNFAIAHPDRLLSLVPVDSGVTGLTPDSEFRKRLEKIVTAANAAGVDEAIRLWCADPLFVPAMGSTACAPALTEIVGGYTGWNWTADATDLDRDVELLDSLASITAPTLVIVGELDLPDFQTAATAMESHIGGARKSVMSGVGHMSNMENPAGFNSLLSEFLAGVS
ncbi:MAG: hypothetical protein HOC77_09050 [Chloroflexi bacterium]|jgi:3-oxoadipate enol-lactonase|nr:hypothetical protein [Chloroflexota bacterium]MBT4073293.1 hypothetical protein [Chloroflexota bacterium]MBT4515218.1 hypothetical protein [Chloroflexota bacterium]MBT5320692.1 hypothetical protein [Chloroflexota bacterium]MBT6681583.1 hypothetical protein [Chloroflexota bacterium]